MQKIPFGHLCILAALGTAILACLLWVAWALLFAMPRTSIPADASFVKGVIVHALV